MQQNLFVDLLAHERNEYRRFLLADIKHYLAASRKVYIRHVCWLVSGLISPAGAGLLWEENTVGWLISSGWDQQANRLHVFNGRCPSSFIIELAAVQVSSWLVLTALRRLPWWLVVLHLCLEGRSWRTQEKRCTLAWSVSEHLMPIIRSVSWLSWSMTSDLYHRLSFKTFVWHCT